MIRTALAAALMFALSIAPADARRHHHRHHNKPLHITWAHRVISVDRSSLGDPRPRAWCGWFMRQHLGVADRRGNLARWWASYGSNAGGPAIGALVVWAHHVGKIVGQSPKGWIVLSGNDGHVVRERPRSLRGAIAFRWP